MTSQLPPRRTRCLPHMPSPLLKPHVPCPLPRRLARTRTAPHRYAGLSFTHELEHTRLPLLPLQMRALEPHFATPAPFAPRLRELYMRRCALPMPGVHLLGIYGACPAFMLLKDVDDGVGGFAIRERVDDWMSKQVGARSLIEFVQCGFEE
ncbi:hypothetical protein BC826DRAFT_1187483 [Russula brevipes]|nr:hypothetical protein BC826DRAFT_1187483 [Russula brevipes]